MSLLGSPARRVLLPAALYVALDELLGVFFQDLVDLVQEVVEVLLELLSLLRELSVTRPAGVFAVCGLCRSRLLPLLLSHGAHLLAPIGAVARAYTVGSTIPCWPWYFPCRSAYDTRH